MLGVAVGGFHIVFTVAVGILILECEDRSVQLFFSLVKCIGKGVSLPSNEASFICVV